MTLNQAMTSSDVININCVAYIMTVNNNLSCCWQTRVTTLRTIKVTESGTIRQCWWSFLLVFYSNFVPKMHCLWDIRLQTLAWTLNWGQGSVKKNNISVTIIWDKAVTQHCRKQ